MELVRRSLSNFLNIGERSLQLYQLQKGEYMECDRSPTFPILPATKIIEFLDNCKTLGITSSLRQFREWVRNQ
ncbi:hypothetical protein H6F77_06755 [Microcoleus sp. FACHB-831]|uniref:hypothetical protein n=1 Tax=Microcoleus sp. FACHB-831 TaxID=2692827 RepID=UPI0016876D8A|nr:hypothetical protein [Microcoleus sp. FACHB-831]MBD1920784.1 hypothetical protein [Microcoleus sp. FACHB-831]